MGVETSVRIAWVLLALLHVAPAMTFFLPGMVQSLYGVAPDGETGVLLVHRGAMFLAVLIVALYAIFDRSTRRLATIVLAVSMIAFLIVYWRAGMPVGGLRKIAIADAVGLVPLAWVMRDAWRHRGEKTNDL